MCQEGLATHKVVGRIGSGDFAGIRFFESESRKPVSFRSTPGIADLIRVCIEPIDASTGRYRRKKEPAQLPLTAAEISDEQTRPQNERGAQTISPRAAPELFSELAQKAQPALRRTVCDCSLIRPRCVMSFSLG